MPSDIELAGYEMHREIGAGGMARVFLATQVSLNREVAIKVLRRSLAGGEDFRQRFLHEARMLAKLIHPNIVPIYDIGQTDNADYMAMEYLSGGTLADRMPEGLSVGEVIRISTQIAHALDLAHRQKIVHRDLKPSNIMFRDELTPVLTDFGIARQTDADHRLTKTGMVVGTPFYMSPEQITGRAVDGRADLYSLGVMFYELLTGELPFQASEPLALAMQHMQEPPPPLPVDLADLQPILDNMLAKDPAQRYQGMLEFCQAIKDLVMSENAFRAKLSTETKLFNSDQFSDPRFQSKGLRVPERVTRDVARVSGAGSATPAATAVRVSQTTNEGKPRPSQGWKIPFFATLGLTAVAAAIYFALTGSGLSGGDQRRVDHLLQRASAYVTVEQIDGAVDMLEQAFAIAPDYPEAVELANSVAVFFENDADDALRQGDLDATQEHLVRGLAIAPQNEGLLAVRTQLEAEIAARARRAQISDLLVRAEGQMEAGNMIEPARNNAYASYQAVLKLDEVNESAAQGLRQIQQRLAATARQAIEEQQLTAARSTVDNARQLFIDSSLIEQVHTELQEAERLVLEAQEVQRLLAQADQLLQARRYVTPPEDNALALFLAVLQRQPDNPPALAGLDTIATHFNDQAQQALTEGNYKTSLAYASAGLRANPEHDSLLQIRQRATAALGELDSRIEQQLQRAEAYSQQGLLLAADEANAFSTYQQVLQLDPGNARANEAIAALPDAVYEEATRRNSNGQLQAAQELLTQAIARYPDQTRFNTLQQQVEQATRERQQAQRLANLLQQNRRLIDTRPLTEQLVTQAAAGIKQIRAEFPNEVGAISQHSALINAISAQATAASKRGDDSRALALLDLALTEFPDNQTLLTSRSESEQRMQQRLRDEAERLAASSGNLAIDARPWGEVIEITDAFGNRKDLPADSTTPLVLSLIEGQYSVLVRGETDGQAQRLEVTVQRQTLVTTQADFSSLNADSYFKRSGW